MNTIGTVTDAEGQLHKIGLRLGWSHRDQAKDGIILH